MLLLLLFAVAAAAAAASVLAADAFAAYFSHSISYANEFIQNASSPYLAKIPNGVTAFWIGQRHYVE